MVEIEVRDELGNSLLTLIWKRGTKEVCYKFPSNIIARASFKALGRSLGVDDATWNELGI